MTVSQLMKKLEKMPKGAKVVIRGNYLEEVKTVDYVEDYCYNETFKLVILNDNN